MSSRTRFHPAGVSRIDNHARDFHPAGEIRMKTGIKRGGIKVSLKSSGRPSQGHQRYTLKPNGPQLAKAGKFRTPAVSKNMTPRFKSMRRRVAEGHLEQRSPLGKHNSNKQT
ncbi:hypothetical protein PGTUg99_027330 [Puccinia graminis f. sp. tritici]|uniref:Uncharacterized protein n=1 Tax=Puccinia graminis f. sp. tritici TaxID=56615 RepID=A0A5B0REU9_PUCGR|nr:hypothetical protein PGTUg99_027330 [Puccinia graminis f. sp. tritici]